MKDDDLDIDFDETPARAPRRPAQPVKAQATSPAPSAGEASAAPAAPARGGWIRGISSSVAGVRGFTWNLRSFVVLLAVLVAIVIIAENWIATRFYLLGFAFEMPRSVSFLIDVAIGALLMWLWLRRGGAGPEADE